MTTKMKLTSEQRSALSAKRLIGSEVHNQEGDKVGTITDILIGQSRGQRVFLIVDFGDYMATKQSQYAIHSDGFTINEAGLPVIDFDVNEEILGQAIGTQEEDLEKIRDQEQNRDIYVYSGIDKWTL